MSPDGIDEFEEMLPIQENAVQGTGKVIVRTQVFLGGGWAQVRSGPAALDSFAPPPQKSSPETLHATPEGERKGEAPKRAENEKEDHHSALHMESKQCGEATKKSVRHGERVGRIPSPILLRTKAPKSIEDGK